MGSSGSKLPAAELRRTTSADLHQRKGYKNGRLSFLIDGVSTDSSFMRRKTAEDNNTVFPEEDYENGTLGVTKAEELHKTLLSLPEDRLFCDPHFPADAHALYYSEERLREAESIVWKRPKDLVEEWQAPYLMVDGMTKNDIKQGILGDCWFLSACAAVSQKEKFISKVMPLNQPLYGKGYKGLVKFRFWRFGEWVDVIIDDQLPTKNKKLIYASCNEPTEFWVALIEKAYAKLHGSYEAIEGGHTMDALVDLTGGLAERILIEDKNTDLYRKIERAYKAGAFITCSRRGDWKFSFKADSNGLVSGHAYTITGIEKIQHKRGEEKLIRVLSPWADGTEWKGSWSDNDVNWTWVDDETKLRLGMESKDDGEFWMSYRDFCRHFFELTICLMGPDFDGDLVSDTASHIEVIKGEWIEGINAGGSRNNIELFATNPQYLLTLTEPDDFDEDTDDPDNEGLCTIVIALMQEHRCSKRNVKVKSLQIGFFLYKTDDSHDRLPVWHFRYKPETKKSGVYINYREVSARFQLEPGHYVIIPTTFKPDCSASFMIRVFRDKNFSLKGPL
ncbi:hypothetical protein CHS0354_036379 [Potamilus streckersoni]|uniref:Calpain catalytic domain-containing protein n=1 Tax=Potamilus streckersoni TaxID=2493646 RepID=A0AAE0SWU7_9BIVA|nr:hypothetical protein CHS0354_036379 [Potamilus streckersoni]